MKIAVIKVGGKAQASEERIAGINQQALEMARDGYKVVILPSAQGSATDDLLHEARMEGGCSGRWLSHYLLHNGEEASGAHFAEVLRGAGARVFLVRPEDDEFFLRGDFCEQPYDNRGMDFAVNDSQYLNCRVNPARSLRYVEPFLRKLSEHDVAVHTAWAVRVDGSIGLIKGRGGSDGSLVALARVLSEAGEDVDVGTKVSDVGYIHDRAGRQIKSIYSGDLIPILEKHGSWPIQRYALEQLDGCAVPIGVSHFSDIDFIGTYIHGVRG